MRKVSILLISILICGLAFAQNTLEKQRFILVQRNEQVSLYPISNNSKFSISPDEEFVISSPDSDDETIIDLKDVTGFGVTTRISDSYHDLINDISVENGAWSITSINGVVIQTSDSGSPDLSGLEKGQVYIIRIGSETFKYVSL